MRIFTLVLVLVTTVSFTGCNEAKQVIDTAGNIQLSGTYTVTHVTSKEVETTLPTITFNALDKTVNGQTGCNSFFGSYTLNLANLTFSEFDVSEKYCEDLIMMQEQKFLEALRNTGTYTYREGVLSLFSADGSILLQARKEQTETN